MGGELVGMDIEMRMGGWLDRLIVGMDGWMDGWIGG